MDENVRRRHAANATLRPRVATILASTISLLSAFYIFGCASPDIRTVLPEISSSEIPRELQKVSIPQYRVEPPDILLIEAVNNVRPALDQLKAGDELAIRVANTLPIDPEGDPTQNEFKTIRNMYVIQTDGTVDLGPEYGSVRIEGLTLDEARAAIDTHLRDVVGLAKSKSSVSMPNVAGKQEISGEHLVRPDGTVSMGIYGNVFVTGMTLDEVKQTLEAHLSRYIHEPEINVDVIAYNSKVIYVITDGGGQGEEVQRLPFTGNETVLDAVAQIEGLSDVSSKDILGRVSGSRRKRVCTDDAGGFGGAITQSGVTDTNYQLLPGDRIFIKADGFIAMDNTIAKVVQPAARIFGFTLLGNGTVQQLRRGKNATQLNSGLF